MVFAVSGQFFVQNSLAFQHHAEAVDNHHQFGAQTSAEFLWLIR